MKKFAISAVAIAGVLILAIYTLNILFTDGMSFPKGSYKYWIAISSDTIKSFPVLDPVKEPIYYYSSGDGPSPAVQEVTYLSSLGERELETRITAFLASQGFNKEVDFFVNGRDAISVTLTDKPAKLVEVRALFTSQ